VLKIGPYASIVAISVVAAGHVSAANRSRQYIAVGPNCFYSARQNPDATPGHTNGYAIRCCAYDPATGVHTCQTFVPITKVP
jgi:hypothetical protein